MSTWRVPSSSGDFTLESAGEFKCKLLVENPTPLELEKLISALAQAEVEGWVGKDVIVAREGRTEIEVEAPLSRFAKVLVPKAYPDKGVLTAVRSAEGKIVCVTENISEAADVMAVKDETKAGEDKGKKATSVKRPTSCCPNNVEGPLKRSSRALREFCTPSQWKSWVDHGYILVRGQLTGYLYRLAHRHHPLAVEHGKMGYDLTNGHVMHFWDWSVPPAEEVLAAKLILEHRESWLRTRSTCLGVGGRPGEIVFPNPLGSDVFQGTWDAGQHLGLGMLL